MPYYIVSNFSECCDSIYINRDVNIQRLNLYRNQYTYGEVYTYESIYGYYVRQEDLIRGRPWYKNDGRSIWWSNEKKWMLGTTYNKGSSVGFAYVGDNRTCLPEIPSNKWKFSNGSDFNELKLQKVECGYKPKGINTIILLLM